MENVVWKFNGDKRINNESTVGFIKSKELEIKFVYPQEDKSRVFINSSINTDETLWKSLLDRFFLINDIHADIEINDFGAKPSTISFRLNQALEISCY